MGTIAAASEPDAREEVDALLSSYLSEDDPPDSGYRRSVDTPVPMAPPYDDGTRREFWSFRRAFAHQARLGRTVPVPAKEPRER